MVEVQELKIKNPENIYKEVVRALYPHREKEATSVEFIVEGTKDNRLLSIRYPGKKVGRRELKFPRANSAMWRNLFDFVVVPYTNGKEGKIEEYTFKNFLEDFEENKKKNEEFWECVVEIYYKNALTSEPPEVQGMDSKLFLRTLKWMWIQEDFNYKLDWREVESPEPYVLETRRGGTIKKGAGKAKFFAALVLLRSVYFTLEEVEKIIPPFG